MTDRKKVSKLGNVIIGVFEPLQALMDTIPETRNDAQQAGEDNRDHTKRTDIGLRILLDQMCRACWFQLHGSIVSNASGQKVPNLVERLNDQQNRLDNQLANFENDPVNAWADPKTILMQHWFDIAVERVNSVTAMFRALTEAYEFFTGQPWKAPASAGLSDKAAVKKPELDEATKKAAEDRMKAFLKKKTAVSKLVALPPA
jgi:hypothetical protein